MSDRSPDQATQPSDPGRRFVDLAAGAAAYTDEGAGPAVVAVHGLPGSARDFRWLAPHLSERMRFLRIDLPGFGETPVATAVDPSPTGRARMVVEVVRALELERPTLLGHSMGGVVACRAVDLEPQLFAGLALVSSPGLRPHPMFERPPFATVSRLLRQPLLRPFLRPLLQHAFKRGGFKGYSHADIERTLQCAAHTSIEEHAQVVRRLKIKTMVAWCQDDPIIPHKIMAELADACPAGPRLSFEKGGHNPQKSHAEELANALSAWPSELGSNG